MKHIISKIICFAVALVALIACDTIPEDSRIIKTTGGEAEKTVLLAEFTGWRCVNCPDAAKVAHELLGTYGDNLIVIGMHPKGSSWTKISPQDTDSINYFGTDIADEYWDFFGKPSSFPIGSVDFTKFAGEYMLDRDLWTRSVQERISIKQPIRVETVCQLEGNKVSVNASVTTKGEAAQGPLSLILLVTEDNIVAPQQEGSVVNKEYVHNHVLRAGITPAWGVSIEAPTESNPTTYTANNYELHNRWNAQNCNVVAIVINSDTKEVLAASQTKLGNGSGEEPQITGDWGVIIENNGTSKELKDGDSITVTKFDDMLGQLIYEGKIVNTKSETISLEILVQRQNITDDSTDEMCILTCVGGNGEEEQTFSAFVRGESEQTFSAHFAPQNKQQYVVWYTFRIAGETTGKKLIVTYDYTE